MQPCSCTLTWWEIYRFVWVWTKYLKHAKVSTEHTDIAKSSGISYVTTDIFCCKKVLNIINLYALLYTENGLLISGLYHANIDGKEKMIQINLCSWKEKINWQVRWSKFLWPLYMKPSKRESPLFQLKSLLLRFNWI